MQTITIPPPALPQPVALIVAALADDNDAAALRHALGTLRTRTARKVGGAS